MAGTTANISIPYPEKPKDDQGYTKASATGSTAHQTPDSTIASNSVLPASPVTSSNFTSQPVSRTFSCELESSNRSTAYRMRRGQSEVLTWPLGTGDKEFRVEKYVEQLIDEHIALMDRNQALLATGLQQEEAENRGRDQPGDFTRNDPLTIDKLGMSEPKSTAKQRRNRKRRIDRKLKVKRNDGSQRDSVNVQSIMAVLAMLFFLVCFITIFGLRNN